MKYRSPGFKSDILRGNFLPQGQPPPASSHILRLCEDRVIPKPISHARLWYHTLWWMSTNFWKFLCEKCRFLFCSQIAPKCSVYGHLRHQMCAFFVYRFNLLKCSEHEERCKLIRNSKYKQIPISWNSKKIPLRHSPTSGKEAFL